MIVSAPLSCSWSTNRSKVGRIGDAGRGQLRSAAALDVALVGALRPGRAVERPALRAVPVAGVGVDEDEPEAGVEDGQRDGRDEAGVERVGEDAPPRPPPLGARVGVEADEQAADRREQEDERLDGDDELEGDGDDDGHAEADPAGEDRPPVDEARHAQDRDTVRTATARPRRGSARIRRSSASMRSSRLYLATRSERDGAPVLIWPVPVATARSAMVVSSVSPERWLMTAPQPCVGAPARWPPASRSACRSG